MEYTKLADKYAIAKAKLDAAKTEVDRLRKEVLEEDRAELVGDCYTVTVGVSLQNRFNADKAKMLLTPEEVGSCIVEVKVETLRVKATVHTEPVVVVTIPATVMGG